MKVLQRHSSIFNLLSAVAAKDPSPPLDSRDLGLLVKG
jgi:hypothetical protein